MNVVMLCGNLGADPEMRQTQTGKPVCNFRIATSECKDKEPEWHSIVAWERTAETCAEYLRKGSKVIVEGRIQSRKYQDKSGNERTAYEIVAHRVHFVSPKPEGQARPASQGSGYGGGGYGGGAPQARPPAPAPDDVLPF